MTGLGYLLRMFPQTSETFVVNEIVELERLGFELDLYSYRRPRESVPHSSVRAIRAPITYVPDPLYRHPRQLWRQIFRFARGEPTRLRTAARTVASTSIAHRNPDAWRRLIQAVYVASRVRTDGIGHLHAHFAHRSTQVAMLTNRLTGIPFSFTAHAKDIYTEDPRRIRERIRAAQFVVTCTRANQAFLQSLAPEDAAKIHVRYHGVDVQKFSPGGATSRPLTVLAVGRLVPKKGFSFLLRACARLKARGHSFRCEIVGDGPERESLEALCRELELADMVSFLGRRSQEELVDLYRRASLLVSPCVVMENGDKDGIPNVLAEAMASGVPVVATQISAIPELVRHGENGLLVSQRNQDELTLALEALLESDALRYELGANGRATVARDFDLATNTRLLAELFEQQTAPASEPVPADRAMMVGAAAR